MDPARINLCLGDPKADPVKIYLGKQEQKLWIEQLKPGICSVKAEKRPLNLVRKGRKEGRQPRYRGCPRHSQIRGIREPADAATIIRLRHSGLRALCATHTPPCRCDSPHEFGIRAVAIECTARRQLRWQAPGLLLRAVG